VAAAARCQGLSGGPDAAAELLAPLYPDPPALLDKTEPARDAYDDIPLPAAAPSALGVEA